MIVYRSTNIWISYIHLNVTNDRNTIKLLRAILQITAGNTIKIVEHNVTDSENTIKLLRAMLQITDIGNTI